MVFRPDFPATSAFSAVIPFKFFVFFAMKIFWLNADG